MKGSRNKLNNGDVFNGITFIKDLPSINNRYNRIGLFMCHCGNIKSFYVNDIIRGHTKSCGCNRTKSNTNHGDTKKGVLSKEYICWQNIISRCYNTKNLSYKNYGGRGIKVCDRWLEKYEYFLSDMGRRPSKNHSIDRIDVNGNYEPSNCRWATYKQQGNNKRKNVIIEYNSIKKTISEWSNFLNLDKSTIAYRFNKGLPLELVFFKGSLQKNKLLTNNGKLTELAKQKINK